MSMMRPPGHDPTKILYLVKTIHTSRDNVFKAWTDPREFKKWFAPEDNYTIPVAEFDFKAGGKYRIGMTPPTGDTYYVTGVFREIKAPLWLVFTWNWEGSRTWNREPQKTKPPESVVIVQLKERDGGRATEVFFWHNGLRDARDIEEHGWGWSKALERLDVHVA